MHTKSKARTVQRRASNPQRPGRKQNPPEFGLASGPIQRKEDLNLTRGELTSTGEGSDAQTKYVHWPHTDASGVTLGKGYDIGSRSASQVITELTTAGMDKAQAEKISKGAGLKGKAAGDWVKKNKTNVGAIAKSVQMNLLANMLTEYTAKAKSTATSTKAAGTTNAAGREKKEGVKAGTYVMSASEWKNLHPAMVELLTDLIYQGGYYKYDRVAKINKRLKQHDGDHLKQFKAVKELFTNGYMDKYAGAIGERKGRKGSKEVMYGQTIDLEGQYRRNQLRLAYINKIITALESGQKVNIVTAGQGGSTGSSTGGSKETKPSTPASGTSTTAPTTAPVPKPKPSATLGTSSMNLTYAQPGVDYRNLKGGVQVHVLASGESMGKVAAKYGLSMQQLKAWNPKAYANASRLPIGTPILLVSPDSLKAAERKEEKPKEVKLEKPETVVSGEGDLGGGIEGGAVGGGTGNVLWDWISSFFN